MHLLTVRYLRIKRRNQTFCLLCQETDSFGQVKEKIVEIMQQHADIRPEQGSAVADEMRLIEASHGDPINDAYDDDTTIQAAQLKDDQVLYLVFRIADNEYEPVEIISTDLQDAPP
jgi:hypothetical protein